MNLIGFRFRKSAILSVAVRPIHDLIPAVTHAFIEFDHNANVSDIWSSVYHIRSMLYRRCSPLCQVDRGTSCQIGFPRLAPGVTFGPEMR